MSEVRQGVAVQPRCESPGCSAGVLLGAVIATPFGHAALCADHMRRAVEDVQQVATDTAGEPVMQVKPLDWLLAAGPPTPHRSEA